VDVKPVAASSPKDEPTARREFLKKIGAASATAPAVAMLFAASQQPSKPQAQVLSNLA
jgi:hypothetical protein